MGLLGVWRVELANLPRGDIPVRFTRKLGDGPYFKDTQLIQRHLLILPGHDTLAQAAGSSAEHMHIGWGYRESRGWSYYSPTG